MKKRMKIGTCLVIVLCFLLQPFAGITASAAGSFSDIKEHWAKSYIELLAERGIVNGYKGKFSPDNTLTKAEAATLICSASGIQPSETVSTSLTDIEGHWGQKYISVLPVVTASNNQFSPNAQITRADFTQMVVGAMYLDLSKADTSTLKQKFKDWATVSEEAMPSITMAVEKGIISGYDDATFRPNHTLTRAEACVILKQAFFPDLRLKPSQYYIDTVADVNEVVSMAVASDKTLYYVDNNTVYHVVNGKSEAVLTGNTTEPVVISTEDILQQPEVKFSDVSITLEYVREQLEKDTEVEFTGFEIAGVACDHVTGKNYAIARSEISYYNPKYYPDGNLHMMLLFDLSSSTQPNATAFSSNSSWNRGGMPNGFIFLVHNGEVYYSSGYTDYYWYSTPILRWNTSSNKITLIANPTDMTRTVSFVDDSMYYFDYNNVKLPSGGYEIIELGGANTHILVDEIHNNPHYSNQWWYVSNCGHDFYFFTSKGSTGENAFAFYRASLLKENISKITPEELFAINEIISKDKIPFEFYDKSYKLWTADADGSMYFVDTKNKIIRKIYGQ